MQELDLIAQALFDKSGFNILALDVRRVCSMTDYFIIAEGNVDRHVKALAESVMEAMKKVGREPWQTEGLQGGEWAVLDYSNIVVHLFTPDMRSKYDIEGVWREGEIAPVKIDTSKKRTCA